MSFARAAAAVFAFAFLASTAAEAQRFYNQQELEVLLYSNRMELDEIPEVSYDYYVIRDTHTRGGNNRVYARHRLYMDLAGSTAGGREYADFLEFINRKHLQELSIGDTLVVPSHFDLDFRAYSPFPRHYAGASEIDKLFIIEKGQQAWAAYEHGKLTRWGIVSTGKEETKTPNGRFNFNWRTLERISSESPPGEEWLMRWVFNFHNERGIHIHQYAMPTTGPASHGCVRLITADAQWIYDWADPWVTTAGRGAMGGTIRRQGSMVLVLGTEPRGAPDLFEHTAYGPVRRAVELPADPWAVPPGSPQQRQFDRNRRPTSARR